MAYRSTYSRRRTTRRRTSYTRKRRRNTPWSNSVGTRYAQRALYNPTVGGGKRIRSRHSADTAEARACRSVVLNAFSDATQQPRFPDGKATESIGFRGQMITEVSQNTPGTIDLLFFAGINTCVVMSGADGTSLNDTQNAAPVKHMTLNRHCRADITSTAASGVTEVNVDQAASTMIAKWRVVSYGLLLSLVNNADENDGWWEAIRITPSNDKGDYVLAQRQVGTDSVEDQPVALLHRMPALSSSQMLANQSYSTGKLRNIHNVTFQLNPEMNTHEFSDLSKIAKINGIAGGDLSCPLDANANEIDNPITLAEDAFNRASSSHVDGWVDLQYDAIFIRIHGQNGTNGKAPSRLTCHTVMNQELVYDERSENQKFHQQPIGDPMLTDKIKQETAAANGNGGGR